MAKKIRRDQSGLMKFLGWASTGHHDPDARYGAHVHNIGLVGMFVGLGAGIICPFLMSEPLALVGFIPVGIMIGFLLLVKKYFQSSRTEVIQSLFIFLFMSYLILTIICYYFRGKGMELTVPWQ